MATATPTEALSDPALIAYEALAPYYDDFTDGYAHDAWLAELTALAAQHGVPGGVALDAACGTGKSSLPLRVAGWDVLACDLSPGMISRARERLGLDDRACFVADVRALPRLPPLDLVLCLDDSLNYLLTAADLEAALTAFAGALKPGGIALFDVNTLATYRTVFASTFERTGRLGTYRWTGHGRAEAGPARIHEAMVDVVSSAGSIPIGLHRQRHHTRAGVERAARRAGLECVACLGQVTGGRVVADSRELSDVKRVHVLRRPTTGGR